MSIPLFLLHPETTRELSQVSMFRLAKLTIKLVDKMSADLGLLETHSSIPPHTLSSN